MEQAQLAFARVGSSISGDRAPHGEEPSIGLDPEMAHSMRETSELLDSVCMQIDSADVTAPMRVMGLRAGPPAISLTISLAALTVSYAFDAWLNGNLELIT